MEQDLHVPKTALISLVLVEPPLLHEASKRRFQALCVVPRRKCCRGGREIGTSSRFLEAFMTDHTNIRVSVNSLFHLGQLSTKSSKCLGYRVLGKLPQIRDREGRSFFGCYATIGPLPTLELSVENRRRPQPTSFYCMLLLSCCTWLEIRSYMPARSNPRQASRSQVRAC